MDNVEEAVCVLVEPVEFNAVNQDSLADVVILLRTMILVLRYGSINTAAQLSHKLVFFDHVFLDGVHEVSQLEKRDVLILENVSVASNEETVALFEQF